MSGPSARALVGCLAWLIAACSDPSAQNTPPPGQPAVTPLSDACAPFAACVNKQLPNGFDFARASTDHDAIVTCLGGHDHIPKELWPCSLPVGSDARNGMPVRARMFTSGCTASQHGLTFEYCTDTGSRLSQRECLCRGGLEHYTSSIASFYSGCGPPPPDIKAIEPRLYVYQRSGELQLSAGGVASELLRLFKLEIWIEAVEGQPASELSGAKLRAAYSHRPPALLTMSGYKGSLRFEFKPLPRADARLLELFNADPARMLAPDEAICPGHGGGSKLELHSERPDRTVYYREKCLHQQGSLLRGLSEHLRTLPGFTGCPEPSRPLREQVCDPAFASARWLSLSDDTGTTYLVDESLTAALCGLFASASDPTN